MWRFDGIKGLIQLPRCRNVGGSLFSIQYWSRRGCRDNWSIIHKNKIMILRQDLTGLDLY